jgi:hypothetical protein
LFFWETCVTEKEGSELPVTVYKRRVRIVKKQSWTMVIKQKIKTGTRAGC